MVSPYTYHAYAGGLGEKGQKGLKGLIGPTGFTGDTGAPGDSGAQGVTGPKGESNDKGQGGGYIFCPLGCERVYLPLCKGADTPFHNQEDDYKYHVYLVLFIHLSTYIQVISQCSHDVNKKKSQCI